MSTAHVDLAIADTNGWKAMADPTNPYLEPGTKAYQKDVADGHLTVLVSHSAFGWHLSISHRLSLIDPATGKPAPGRIPTWEEIKEARYRFLPDAIVAALLLPPQAKYVNLHATTMHLWQVDDKYAE